MDILHDAFYVFLFCILLVLNPVFWIGEIVTCTTVFLSFRLLALILAQAYVYCFSCLHHKI